MKKLNNFYQIDAFTNKAFNGNSAAVVFSDDLNETEINILRGILKAVQKSTLAKTEILD